MLKFLYPANELYREIFNQAHALKVQKIMIGTLVPKATR
jgi:hypothetical protein